MNARIPQPRPLIFSTYAAQAAATVATLEGGEQNDISRAMNAAALREWVRHYAEKADSEAANTQRICNSLSEYEKAAPVHALEYDEVHDFLDYLKAGLGMRYDDCDEMQVVRDSFKRLQADLCELENMLGATDALDAWTDARIKAEKEAA